MKIGFIGLGLMGEPMARNILKKGFDPTVFNRTASKSSQLKKLGAKVALAPKELASQVEVVVTMVTGPKDVEEVIFGKEGVAKGAKKGLVIIDMSTIGPSAARKFAKKLGKHKIQFLDAPVTGSVPKAMSGGLTIFIGGEVVVYKKVKQVLQAMGTNLHFLGPVGSGQAIKLINNCLVATSISGLAEGMLLADAQGLPRQKVMEALSDVPATSPFMKLKMPSMISHDFKTLFSAANMFKDLKLAQLESKKLKLPVLSQVEKLYGKTSQNYGEEDLSAVLKTLEKTT